MRHKPTWAVRILTGPQAGQIVPLANGYNILGRSPACQIKIASNSVSKEHATILLTEDGKVLITDMNSRNGTFVNGLRVQNQKLSAGDKLTFHDVVVDILELPPGFDPRFVPGASPGGGLPMPSWAGNAAVAAQSSYSPPMINARDFPQSQQAQMHAVHPSANPGAQSETHHDDEAKPHLRYTGNGVLDFFENFKLYIDHVAMPGIYAIVQRMSYRQGLMMFVAAYVMIVTVVATVPMVTLTKKSIRQESVRRAKTIARNLAVFNRQAILDRNEIAATVRHAELEEGVTNAIIMAKDGTILAPANKRGEFAKLPFVNQARREERESDGFINDSNLGVAVPISRYNPETGQMEAAAYAVVIYDMGSQAMNSGQTLGLFLQIFFLAGIIGGVLYFFLVRVVEHPISTLGLQLDEALREGRDDLSTIYKWPLLEKLVGNINSALTRAANGGGSFQASNAVLNRDIEATNVVRMLQIPAVSINAIDNRIIATNSAFDRLLGSSLQLAGRSLLEIPDSALQGNLNDLIPQMRDQLGNIAFSEIPFSGQNYEVNGQAIVGNAGEASWYLVTLNGGG
jgi:hypothetical protein